MSKVKALATIKKRIAVLESYRKDCMKKLQKATQEGNEISMMHYSKEHRVSTLRIKDLKWVIGNED